MGNVIGKKDDEVVDGGFVFPTGLVYQKSNCDLRVVRKLVIEQRISPCYKGNPDEEDSTMVECPICFLYYPSNINYSRCCNQPICTECFLQIQQPKTGGPACCPFCVQPDYGVYYNLPKSESPSTPPDKKEKKKETKFVPLPPHSNQVVTIDMIRPNGRHHPPPPEPEHNVRRMTIGSRASSARVSSTYHRRHHITSSSFTPDNELPAYRAIPSPPSRFTVRDVEAELENLMLMEAIHLSLLEQERERQKQPPASPDQTSAGNEGSKSKAKKKALQDIFDSSDEDNDKGENDDEQDKEDLSKKPSSSSSFSHRSQNDKLSGSSSSSISSDENVGSPSNNSNRVGFNSVNESVNEKDNHVRLFLDHNLEVNTISSE